MAGGPFISAAGFEDYDCDQRYFGRGIEVSEAVSNKLCKHTGICRPCKWVPGIEFQDVTIHVETPFDQRHHDTVPEFEQCTELSVIPMLPTVLH